MPITRIESIEMPEIKLFYKLTDQQLRKELEAEGGIFIAESPKVIRRAIEAGYEPISILCEQKHIEGDAREIIQNNPGIEVYYGERAQLEQLTGYVLTRGVLCAMKRKPLPCLDSILKEKKLAAVIDNVSDASNIGSIFRSAAALGVDAIILREGACDPLNRRAIRVSMGAVFKIPWTVVAEPIEELKRIGWSTIAMALRNDTVLLDSPLLKELERKALILGNEGDGLNEETIGKCDYTMKIPMYHGVDSLNVAVSAAVAFWELRKKG